jgi:peptide-methionine (S)-S-oxide reductase
MLFGQKSRMPAPEEALRGRPVRPFVVPVRHAVLGTPLEGPYPPGLEIAYFALGCFWGAERLFWQTPGVWSTAVGYAGGYTPNPTYEEVCSGLTGHTEVVQVVYDPSRVSYQQLLKVFWEGHDPTQGYRQGNDIGTQYRSAIYVTSDEQAKTAEESRVQFQDALSDAGLATITTDIQPARPFYFAEEYHQQYLSDTKNPNGYCGLGGTGVSCPIGVAKLDS